MSNIWSDDAPVYNELLLESHKVCLHPCLREHIKRIGARHILDFGCGDGSMYLAGDVSYESLCLFDPSEQMIKEARKLFANRPEVRFETSARNLPDGRFDLTICSLVLMTISSPEELQQVVATIKRCLADGGNCVVAVTHPCFRQYRFSTFCTEFCGTPFNYLSEGLPFTVTLTDMSDQHTIEFTDFHWSLSFTLNLFLERDLRLTRIFELPDCPVGGSSHNSDFPGYLIFFLQKAG